MKKKAQMTFYLVWVITGIFIVLGAALIIPFGALFTVEAYSAGEMIWNLTEPDINNIQDANVRAAVGDAVSEAKSSTSENVVMVTDIFQYSWVILLVILVMIAFLFTRKNVEYGGGVV